MSELVADRIRATAAKLGLPHLACSLDHLVNRAAAAKMGYLNLLDLTLSDELAIREDSRFHQGLRLSKLPHHKTLDEYDFSFQPDLDPRKIKDLSTLTFVQNKANAALLGPPGVGKTHIAVRSGRRGVPGWLLDLLHDPRRHGPPPQGRRRHRPPGPQDAHLPAAQRPRPRRGRLPSRSDAPRPTSSSSSSRNATRRARST